MNVFFVNRWARPFYSVASMPRTGSRRIFTFRCNSLIRDEKIRQVGVEATLTMGCQTSSSRYGYRRGNHQLSMVDKSDPASFAIGYTKAKFHHASDKYKTNAIPIVYNPMRRNSMQRRYFSDISFIDSLVQVVQSSLIMYHNWSGLPWWATFASSTVFVRLALFPLSRLQMLVAHDISRAFPEMSMLTSLYMRRRDDGQMVPFKESIRLFIIYIQGVRACLVLHDAPVKRFFIYPIVNLVVFLTFVYSLRSLITESADLSFETGGFSWFTDLTVSDPTYMLPFTAIGLSYTALAYAFHGDQTHRFRLIIQDVFQCTMILGMPMYIDIVSGVFFYWIPSSMLAIVQNKILRTPYFRNILRLPPMPTSIK